MGVINTGLLEAGLKSDFFARLKAVPAEWEDLCTRIPSTLPYEKYRWLGSAPTMRAWGSGRLAKGLRSESYDVTNQKYEATIEVDRDEISDDQTGQIRLRVAELADRAAMHKTILVEDLLNHGGSSGYNSYDGVTYFNDAHISGESGSQDNNLTADAADADAPTVAEFKEAIKLAIAQMAGFKDDIGMPLRLGATGLVVVTPPTMYFTALEALQATVVAATTNVLAGAARVMMLPGLTTGTTFYLCKTDGVVRPFIFQDREPIEFGAVAEGSEEEFKREKYFYGVRGRYAIAYGLPFACVRVQFQAS